MARKRRTTNDAPVRRGDSASFIYDAIRHRILSLELAPGAAIDEAALVREFGKSRTPVREALVRLASVGLVVLLPNRGSQVAPLDLSSIRDNLEAIDLCQRAVTAWAAVRRQPRDIERMKERAAEFEKAAARKDAAAMVLTNRAFHAAIADACGNLQIAAAYNRILDEGLRIARFSLNSLYGGDDSERRRFVDIIVREHKAMIAAIERRDAERARRRHLAHRTHAERLATFGIPSPKIRCAAIRGDPVDKIVVNVYCW